MKSLLFLLLTLFGQMSLAQNNPIFFGGQEDGAATTVTEIASHNAVFGGGIDDGAAIQYHSQASNNRIFAGGNEDGYAHRYFSQSDNNAIFGGGNEDGFAVRYHSLADHNRIFSGGIDDGGHAVTISIPDNNGIFGGGIDDGGAHFYATGLPASFPAPFAVALLDFEAIPLPDKVQLVWTTLSETNHDYFRLERSADLVQIESIGQVPGQGSPDIPQSYEQWDFDPLEGRSYYRLVSVDINGEAQTSDWVEVLFASFQQTMIQAFPNPTSGLLTLRFDQEADMAQVMPQLFDMQGRRLSVRFQQENATTLTTDLSALPHAIYLLKLIDPQTELPVSFRIQKK